MTGKEEEMIKLLKERNILGMELLYDHYAALLFGYIWENIQNEVKSEKILKETFYKISQNIIQYDSHNDRLVSWMINICRSLILEKGLSKNISSQNKNQDKERNVSGNISGESYNPGIIGKDEIIKKLEPEYYKIIDLLFMKGMNQPDVAANLNIPLGTVKTRSHAAVQKLRSIFQENRIAG
jgi:RNA polymerase sigma factor (sigma-70 family)